MGNNKATNSAHLLLLEAFVVTLELERAPGVDGVLRVRVAGKTLRELRESPRGGMPYPAVGLDNRWQSITMVAVPRECTSTANPYLRQLRAPLCMLIRSIMTSGASC